VELVFENVNMEALDLDRISRGVARVAQQVPRPDDVTVVFTGDFEQSIRSRSIEQPEYTADRLGGMGFASAMTLAGEGPECTIVASAAFFVVGEEIEQDLDGVRLLGHEGWHAAIHQRGEETGDVRLRRGLGDTAIGFLHATAGVAIGEYRVERSLCNEHWWPLDTYLTVLSSVLEGVRSRLRAAIVPAPDLPDKVWTVVTQDLHQLLTHLSYLAGQELASGRTRLPTSISQSDDWNVVVGDYWGRLLDLLDTIAPADVPTGLSRLDALTASLAETVPTWLARSGLAIADTESGIYVSHSGLEP